MRRTNSSLAKLSQTLSDISSEILWPACFMQLLCQLFKMAYHFTEDLLKPITTCSMVNSSYAPERTNAYQQQRHLWIKHDYQQCEPTHNHPCLLLSHSREKWRRCGCKCSYTRNNGSTSRKMTPSPVDESMIERGVGGGKHDLGRYMIHQAHSGVALLGEC